jgi:hypothetical protein
VQAFNKKLKECWSELPPQILTSVKNKVGKEPILDYIADCIKTAQAFTKKA